MEIIDSLSPVFLSNAEVLASLSTPHAPNQAHANKKRLPQNVLTIDFEVAQYLASTASTPPLTAISAMLTELAKWPLTRAERLMLVNTRPQSVVEFHVCVEECEERFTEHQIGTILGVLKL